MARKAATRSTPTARPIDPADRDRQILAALDLRSEFISLGVVFASDIPNSKGYITCYARFREESSPSAGANVFTGRYNDFGGEQLSFWEFAAKAGNFADWRAAREHYAERLNIPPVGKGVGSGAGNSSSPIIHKGNGTPPVKPPAVASHNGQPPARNPFDQLAFEDWTKPMLNLLKYWTIQHKRGPTVEACLAAGARRAIYSPFRNGKSKFQVLCLPVYSADDLSAPPMSYVIYELTKKSLPRSLGKGKGIEWMKPGRPKTIGPVSGGMLGLHGLGILAKHAEDPAAHSIDVAWKTEGPTDMLTLWASIPAEVRDRNPVVCNPAGATENVQQSVLMLFAGVKVAIVHDADSTGELGGRKWGAEIFKVASEVRHVRLPFEVEPKHGKDLRDWLMERKVKANA